MIRQRNLKNPHESGLFGLFEGKKKEAEAAKIAAKAAAETAAAQSKQIELLLKLQAAKEGYDPEKTAADQAIKLEETKQGSEKTLYLIIAAVVAVLMAGIYFIKKK
jgi:hypothetical protein